MAYLVKRVGISSLLALITFAAIAVGLEAVSTVAQDHPGVGEPPDTSRGGSKPGHFNSKARLLPAEVLNSKGGKLKYEDDDIQRNLPQEREQISVQVDNPQSSDENLERSHVKLVIAVPSVRPDRREAIRETWLKWGDDRVILRFFTELPNKEIDGNGEEVSALLAEESLTYGDIVLQDISMGMNFGLKLLWAMRWMSCHYSFDFFLRLDDDYFLCLERLLDDLDCLLISGEQQSPIYAGYRACREDHKASYMDESYILLSSVIIDRVLAVSDLKCSGYGSLTAGAWLRVGGPGNPEGDVAFVNDYRLDRWGDWWKHARKGKHDRSEYSRVCEQTLGIHHTYPDDMYELWVKLSSRTNVSQSTSGDCEALFRYEDDGECPYVSRAVDDKYLRHDNVQLCDSFSTPKNSIWCGGQGC